MQWPIIEFSKIHDTVVKTPSLPSPRGRGQGGGKAVIYYGNINKRLQLTDYVRPEYTIKQVGFILNISHKESDYSAP